MNDYLNLLIGIVCAAAGGELFVRGAVGMASRLRVSAGIIGATVAAFATSSPELSIAVQSAMAGEPELSFGNALGANVVNIAVILGVALSLAPLQCPKGSVSRDLPVALLVPVLTAALIFDGVVSRLDGLMMLAAFSVWIVFTVLEARRQRSEAAEILGSPRLGAELVQLASGLLLLGVSGNRIVAGASGLAFSWGLDEFIVGATVVSLGTTVPELVTMIISKYRGHSEVGLGTVLGSNIFNGLFIVGTAATIHPIRMDWKEVDTALLFGGLAVAFTWPTGDGILSRRRGLVLLVLYAVYLGVVLQRPQG